MFIERGLVKVYGARFKLVVKVRVSNKKVRQCEMDGLENKRVVIVAYKRPA